MECAAHKTPPPPTSSRLRAGVWHLFLMLGIKARMVRPVCSVLSVNL